MWGNKGIKSKKQLNLITLINVNNSYASFGFDNLSFIIGRDRLGVGNGYTGNLELGENTFFDDFAKLSFINDFISYDFTITSFNHDSKGSEKRGIHADSELDGMKKMFLSTGFHSILLIK